MLRFEPTVIYEGDAVVVDGCLYHTWAKALAQVVGPKILEIGFGVGVLHAYLHQQHAKIEVLELHSSVLERYKQCKCVAYVGDWVTTIQGQYNTIVYDVEVNPKPHTLAHLKQHLLPEGCLYIHTTKPREHFEVA